MQIDNSPFENFPIEFKEINPEDFTVSGSHPFNVENDRRKLIITPNTRGYINDDLQANINLNHKNTVVINAAVGQGKSYAIIQTIKRYYDLMQREEQQYLIFVASPFVSLVKQYCNDIEESGIPESQIFNYSRLGREEPETLDYAARCIQVVTANTLLGNPGQDAFINSEAKRSYINVLRHHCGENNIKVIFIYDEIHDSYHNFKMEYIFNLWKWRDVIQKNFILSATYNEASKIVIEYLAELTDRRIQIIESRRERFPAKQSKLHLHYSADYNFTNNTPEIKNLIKDLVADNKKIDILCYSKSLAKSLINPKEEIGRLLKTKFGQVKDCTSHLVANVRMENLEPGNLFDNSKCNIGTNFKTGVSIKKENHAFIIIMPPRATKLGFSNKYGIFSGGINSIIQAIARQRTSEDIHIILSKPDHFDYASLSYSGMTQEQIDFFRIKYEEVKYYKEPKLKGRYYKLNTQDLLMKSFFENQIFENVEDEVNYIESLDRNDLPKLNFPTFDQFKIEKGEDYLASKYPFFGKDISTYLTYAALTNQFINCKLVEFNAKSTLWFKRDEVFENLMHYFSHYLKPYYSLEVTNTYLSFSYFYEDVRNFLFREFILKYKNRSEWKKINPYQNKDFEYQLLIFSIRQYYGLRYFNEDAREINRSRYFLDSIMQSINLRVNQGSEDNEEMLNKVEFYRILDHFRKRLIENIMEFRRGNKHYYYLPSNLFDSFFDQDSKDKFDRLLDLIPSEPLIANNIFEFKRRFETRNLAEKHEAFYRLLIEDFVEIERRSKRTINGILERHIIVSSIKFAPRDLTSVNLINEPSFNEELFQLDDEALIEEYGTWENYQEKINTLLNSI